MSKPILWIEFLILFGLVPLLYSLGHIPLPKIPVLFIIFICCLLYLFKSPDFKKTEMIAGLKDNRDSIKSIALRSLAVAVLSIAVVLVIAPSQLFIFPLTRPLAWLLVMLLYPLFSAYPQELIYRVFLFHRYKPIMQSTAALTCASVLTFSFLHIIFGNWVAVALTLPAGYIFTRTYQKTGSLLLASIEHAAYGCIIFTTGLGSFFYNPS